MAYQWHSTEPEDPRPGDPGTPGAGAPHIRWVRVSYDRWRTTPSWVQRILGAFVLLILLGLSVLLLVGGLIVGAIVAGVLAVLMGIAWIAQRLRAAIDGKSGSPSGDDFRGSDFRENFRGGRKNVRVIGPTQRH